MANVSLNYAISILREASARGSNKRDADGNPIATKQDLINEFGRLYDRGNRAGAELIGTFLRGGKDKLGYLNQVGALDGDAKTLSIQDLVGLAAKGITEKDADGNLDSRNSIGTLDFKVLGGNRYAPGTEINVNSILRLRTDYKQPNYYYGNSGGGYLPNSGGSGYGSNSFLSFFQQLFQNFFGGFGGGGYNPYV